MTHAAKILADSVSPDGVRLTTLEVVMPRIVLAEFNTHRMLSRNSASSRAIPVKKMLQRVMDDPYIPSSWGKNQKGMQADRDVDAKTAEAATQQWLQARDHAVAHAHHMIGFGIHKQLTNRLLEPFMWHTVICTATEFSNFFHLRRHPHAHPDIRLVADKMWEAMEASEPKKLGYEDWHLPLIFDEDWEWSIQLDPTHPTAVVPRLVKVSVGRCARVSYLTHDGKRDPQADIDLHDRLLAAGHMSPFEHVARPLDESDIVATQIPTRLVYRERRDLGSVWCGNFRGWVQHRSTIPNEHDILRSVASE